MTDTKSIFIRNVRCLFPAIHAKPIFKGEEAKNYGCKILFHKEKDAVVILDLKKAIQSIVVDVLREKKLPVAAIALADGDESAKSYFEGYWVLSANSRVKPYVVASNGKDRITDPSEDKIYNGCNVDCRISFWAQQPGATWGKRVNCNLLAIRFASDGVPHESGGVPVAEVLEGFDVQEDATETPDW